MILLGCLILLGWTSGDARDDEMAEGEIRTLGWFPIGGFRPLPSAAQPPLRNGSNINT